MERTSNLRHLELYGDFHKQRAVSMVKLGRRRLASGMLFPSLRHALTLSGERDPHFVLLILFLCVQKRLANDATDEAVAPEQIRERIVRVASRLHRPPNPKGVSKAKPTRALHRRIKGTEALYADRGDGKIDSLELVEKICPEMSAERSFCEHWLVGG